MHPSPLREADLIFPSSAFSTASAISSLKKSALSVHNRLASILADAAFVASVAASYRLPLVANERCGSWYVPSRDKAASAYFKSTDGHAGQWAFSARRLNLHVLELVGDAGGGIIVDSTRRGKSMPDALSKTVPIWCCVWNRVLFPDRPDCHELLVPIDVVSASEKAQIESRLKGFQSQLKAIGIDTQALRTRITKPLRPLWVTPSYPPSPSPQLVADFHLLVLCTSSRLSSPSPMVYVQGAADDSETWALGLTPQLFWSDPQLFLTTPEDDLPALVSARLAAAAEEGKNESSEGVAEEAPGGSRASEPTRIRPTTAIYVASSTTAAAYHANFDRVIECAPAPTPALQGWRHASSPPPQEGHERDQMEQNPPAAEDNADGEQGPLGATERPGRYLHVRCRPGKLGSRDLRPGLPLVAAFARASRGTDTLLCVCPSGGDLALGAALAVAVACCGDDGEFRPDRPVGERDKALVRRRLAWISASLPAANPSRATLNAVNSYLLGSRG